MQILCLTALCTPSFPQLVHAEPNQAFELAQLTVEPVQSKVQERSRARASRSAPLQVTITRPPPKSKRKAATKVAVAPAPAQLAAIKPAAGEPLPLIDEPAPSPALHPRVRPATAVGTPSRQLRARPGFSPTYPAPLPVQRSALPQTSIATPPPLPVQRSSLPQTHAAPAAPIAQARQQQIAPPAAPPSQRRVPLYQNQPPAASPTIQRYQPLTPVPAPMVAAAPANQPPIVPPRRRVISPVVVAPPLAAPAPTVQPSPETKLNPAADQPIVAPAPQTFAITAAPVIPPAAPAMPQPMPPAATIPPPPPVATAPVAANPDGEVDVKFYTPEPMGEALPPGTVLPPEAQAAAAQAAAAAPVAATPSSGDQLSQETLDILAALPADALPKPETAPPPAPVGTVDIQRAIDQDTIPRIEEVQGIDENGMNIRVKQRSIDVNYELEKAYNALISGDTSGATRIYEDVLSVEPNEKTALFGLATTYHRIGLLDKARPVYGKLLKLDPYNVEALNNFLALVGAEAPRAAIEQLQRLEQENPAFSPVPAQISLLYQKLGEYPQAIDYMRRAVELSPDNLAYRYNLGVMYDTAKQRREAIAIYRYLLQAYQNGQELPASPRQIQERLTFLASN